MKLELDIETIPLDSLKTHIKKLEQELEFANDVYVSRRETELREEADRIKADEGIL